MLLAMGNLLVGFLGRQPIVGVIGQWRLGRPKRVDQRARKSSASMVPAESLPIFT